MPQYLSDHRRTELVIPALLLAALTSKASFGVVEEDRERVDEDAHALEAKQKLKAWTTSAMVAPVADMLPKKQNALLRRAERVTVECTGELDGQSVIKIAMVLYYWLEELAQRDILHVVEGSEIGQAMELLLPMMGYGFARGQLDRSAHKQALRLLGEFQKRGFYRQVQVQAVA